MGPGGLGDPGFFSLSPGVKNPERPFGALFFPKKLTPREGFGERAFLKPRFLKKEKTLLKPFFKKLKSLLKPEIKEKKIVCGFPLTPKTPEGGNPQPKLERPSGWGKKFKFYVSPGAPVAPGKPQNPGAPTLKGPPTLVRVFKPKKTFGTGGKGHQGVVFRVFLGGGPGFPEAGPIPPFFKCGHFRV